MATSSDVARLAGVSRATVSAIFNGKAREQRISPETEERVRAAAAELGYRSPFYARSLSTGRSLSIGFVSLGDDAAAADACFATAARVCQQQGRLLSWAGVQADGDLVEIPHPLLHDLAGGIAECLSDRHDGLLICCRADRGITDACVQVLREQTDVPVVVISDDTLALPLQVVSDPERAWHNCAEHLVLHGHRQAVALVDDPETCSAWPQASACTLTIHAADDQDALARCWGDDPRRPTALIVDSLSQAANAARLLGFNGCPVPRSCSLICLAPPDPCSRILPAVASLDRDWSRCGQAAAELLLQRLADPDLAPTCRRVHGRFTPQGGIETPR